jgi:hypothetical protein
MQEQLDLDQRMHLKQLQQAIFLGPEMP